MILVMTVFLLLEVATLVVSKCPQACRCSHDHQGRPTVRCYRGQMYDVIPALDMDYDTQILVIEAPPYKPNYLSLGPIFQGLRKLEEVHILWSSIPNIGDHTFWGLHNLLTINLTWNHLTGLKESNFKGIKNLEVLDLSHNRIESIPSAVFRSVKKLRTLDLSYNFLPQLVPRIFFGLTTLETLDLSYNPLKDINDEIFKDVPTLTQLKCAGCQINVLPTNFLRTLSSLRYLDLSNNRLMGIPLSRKIRTNLHHLNLNGNHINSINEFMLVGSPFMKELLLSNNDVETIDRFAFYNSSLQHLDLSYNRLTSIVLDDSKEMYNHLKILKLSGNGLNLRQLFMELDRATKIVHLSIGDMGLNEFPLRFFAMKNSLQEFNLSKNDISAIPVSIFDRYHALSSLDLSHNGFRGMDPEFMSKLDESSSLKVLNLENNPWQCDKCHVGPLLSWLHGAPDQQSGCSEPKVWTCLKCDGPPRFQDLQLAMLPLADLPNCPNFIKDPNRSSYKNPAIPLVNGPFRQNDGESAHDILTAIEAIPDIDGGLRNEFGGKLYTFFVAMSASVSSVLVVSIIGFWIYRRQGAHYYTKETIVNRSNDNGFETFAERQKAGTTKIAMNNNRSDGDFTSIASGNNASEATKSPGKSSVASDSRCTSPKYTANEFIRILDCEPRPGNA